MKNLIKKYKMHQVVILAYYLQANEIMKRDHKLIVNLLAKLSVIKREN